MSHELERVLGLPAAMSICIGAMVGSGVFVLPGIAFVDIGGPAVVAAFLVAGVLVLPTALSASEMATAMPQAGGSYVFVARGLGPFAGTIAGVGNWFMLQFKGALALIGGVPYLVYVLPAIRETSVPVFGDPIIPIALAVGTAFIVLNLVSTSGTGSAQFLIVAVMLVVMVGFTAAGFGQIDPDRTAGAFDVGQSGFLGVTALVFITYAGVVKVAAVAGEVKDPGRVIPRAIIGALAVTTALYTAVIYVTVGVVDVQGAIDDGVLDPSGEGAIVAIAADNTLGTIGVVAVTVAALLALASTANAGLLSGSRFPFAMARDNLAPAVLTQVDPRFNTPTVSVAVTGVVMLGLVAVVPIEQVAKFGSAFQIIVFVLINTALIAFRRGAIEGYAPAFTAPLYPWVQLFGIGTGLVVLTQIGTVPLVGAAAIVALSVAYYVLYARRKLGQADAN